MAGGYRGGVRAGSQTNQPALGNNLPIIPGMVAEVDIVTGEKSVLTYLLKPVVPRPDPIVEDDVAPPVAVPETDAKPKLTLAPEPEPEPKPSPDKPRPWETEHTWADDIDLFLARRRAVNG